MPACLHGVEITPQAFVQKLWVKITAALECFFFVFFTLASFFLRLTPNLSYFLKLLFLAQVEWYVLGRFRHRVPNNFLHFGNSRFERNHSIYYICIYYFDRLGLGGTIQVAVGTACIKILFIFRKTMTSYV